MNAEIKAIIEGNAPMTMEQIIKQEVDDWLTSMAYRWMINGERYYLGSSDILQRKREIIGDNGLKVEDRNLANNKLVHNFLRKLTDQKVGYLLSKPMSIQTEKEEYGKALSNYFDKAMHRTIKNIGKEAVNKGIGWLHIYYDEQGVLSFKKMRSEEIIPIWQDDSHTQLQAVIRRYEVETYETTTKKMVVKVEWWDTNGVLRFIYDGGILPEVLENEKSNLGSHFVHTRGDQELPLNWERVPFIPFKYNDEEQPLIELIKSLVDDYDARSSDNANNLEDLPNSIYVLKNYDGTDLGEFRKNLAAYRAVKVTDDGGVDTISLEIDTEAFKTHVEMTRKDIYEFGRGVDTQSDKFGNSPSGVALRFLYADLDIDANIIETEFQASLEQLLWFIDTHLANSNAGDFSNEPVDIIFNRDNLVNETETIKSIQESVGILSRETLVANHPYVTDMNDELKRLEDESKKAMEDANVYPTLTNEDGTGGVA